MNPITHTRLTNLAAQLRLHGELLATKDLRTKIITHHQTLTTGIKAATTDTDGTRNSETTSQPEAAAINKPDPGQHAANRINRLITQTETLLQELAHLEQTATNRPKPTPVECPKCTPGLIHPGQALCDNEQCGTRSLKGECQTCGTQTNTAGPIKTRPIKGQCRTCYDAARTDDRGQRRKGNPNSPWFDKTELIDADKIITTNPAA